MAEPTTEKPEVKTENEKTENVNVEGLIKKKEELLAETKAAKEKARALEEKLLEYEAAKKQEEQKRLEEQGKFQELYTQSETEKNELAKAKAELEKAVNSFKEAEEKERKALLEQLNDEDREIFKDANKMQLQALIKRKEPKDSLTTPPQQRTGKDKLDFTKKENWDKGILDAVFRK